MNLTLQPVKYAGKYLLHRANETKRIHYRFGNHPDKLVQINSLTMPLITTRRYCGWSNKSENSLLDKIDDARLFMNTLT